MTTLDLCRELRIGNLVKIENDLLPETSGEIYKVSGINLRSDYEFPDSKSVISLDHTKSLRTYSQFDEFVRPVELTGEWLIKFGFEIDSHGFVLPDKNSLSFSITKNGLFSPCWLDKQLFPGLIYVGSVKYVHQLQNLYYALTQTELTPIDQNVLNK
jgi:hypothetical protein